MEHLLQNCKVGCGLRHKTCALNDLAAFARQQVQKSELTCSQVDLDANPPDEPLGDVRILEATSQRR